MSRNIETGTRYNDQEALGTGYLHFAPQTNNFIDAEACQDQQLILMLRERAAARRHQAPVIEVW